MTKYRLTVQVEVQLPDVYTARYVVSETSAKMFQIVDDQVADKINLTELLTKFITTIEEIT